MAAALTKTSAEVIAIDGKTVRRSYQKKGGEEPIHVVSAFAARQRMVLGQVKVGEKSNEIVAIPALLGLLAIEGAVVTVDAMGCQREIAQTIIDKKADYILALKGNQGTLRDDVELFAREQKAVALKRPRRAPPTWPSRMAMRATPGSCAPSPASNCSSWMTGVADWTLRTVINLGRLWRAVRLRRECPNFQLSEPLIGSVYENP